MIKLNIIDVEGKKLNVADIKKLSILVQNKSSYSTNVKGIWGDYIAHSGIGYFQIRCGGVMCSGDSDDLLLKYAFENLVFRYEFVFSQDKNIVSFGKIDSYEKTFRYLEADEFLMVISSSGKVEML